MKKTLIALAAVAATGAYAQSSVTLYGIVDVGYQAKKWSTAAGTLAKSSGIVDGAAAGSRFGFRGTEDLGGGLKAEFVIEQGLSPTSQQLTNVRTASSGFQNDAFQAAGATAPAGITSGRSLTSLNRQSYVGLAGGFGTVRLGYQYNNLYELSTLSGFVQTSEGVHGADFAHVAGQGWVGGTRAPGVTYISPNMGGFEVRFQYGGVAATTVTSFTHAVPGAAPQVQQSKNERVSVMGKYTAGPLAVALAHTQLKTGTAAGGAALATTSPSVTQLGGSYDFGVVKVGGTYTNGDNDAGRDLSAYSLSAAVPFGAAKFIVGYQKQKEETGAVTNLNASGWQLGVTYDLSKRTQAYFYTGTTKDKVTTLKQSDSFFTGIRHSF